MEDGVLSTLGMTFVFGYVCMPIVEAGRSKGFRNLSENEISILFILGGSCIVLMLKLLVKFFHPN